MKEKFAMSPKRIRRERKEDAFEESSEKKRDEDREEVEFMEEFWART